MRLELWQYPKQLIEEAIVLLRVIEVLSAFDNHNVDELVELQPPLHIRHYDIDVLKQKHHHVPISEVQFALIRQISLFELLRDDQQVIHGLLHCLEFQKIFGLAELVLKEVGEEGEEIARGVSGLLFGMQLYGHKLKDELID